MMYLGAAFAGDSLGTDFGAIRDVAQALEDTGFDSIATNDHVIGGHPDRAEGHKVHTIATPAHEPIVLLSFIGAVTTRIELATAVLLLPQRQTTLVAKQAADPDTIGIECGIRATSGDDPDRWVALAHAYRDLGATHLKVMTGGPDLERPQDHLNLMTRWHRVVAPEVSGRRRR